MRAWVGLWLAGAGALYAILPSPAAAQTPLQGRSQASLPEQGKVVYGQAPSGFFVPLQTDQYGTLQSSVSGGGGGSAGPARLTLTKTTVAIPANTSTTLFAASSTVQSLIIQFPGTSTCYVNFGGPADTTGLAFGSAMPGYSWGPSEPPPLNGVFAYCSAAVTATVVAGQ